jgi:hypothetical protein
MISPNRTGKMTPIRDVIDEAYRNEVVPGAYEKQFFQQLKDTRERLKGRIGELPSDSDLRSAISRVSPQTIKVLVESKPWDNLAMGGEEADVDLLWASPTSAA